MTPFTFDKEDANGKFVPTVVNADSIRREMGAFDDKLMKQPAKYGARLALVRGGNSRGPGPQSHLLSPFLTGLFSNKFHYRNTCGCY